VRSNKTKLNLDPGHCKRITYIGDLKNWLRQYDIAMI